MAFVDPQPEYWKEYSNLQKVKHDLIRCYLQGWFPKLGFWAGRIFYFDTHAGRGKHMAGQLGSPLVALDTLLNHSHCKRILARSDVRFVFIERDEANVRALQQELAQHGALPHRISCDAIGAECFAVLTELLESFKQPGRKLAPAFFFIDPYGFKIPGGILRDLMTFERVELFLNVIWRELDMALQQPDRMAETLDLIFGGNEWRQRINSDDHATRADQCVDLMKEMTGARWATYVRMLGDNNATRYLLLHLTNHDAGRDLMKDCIWKVCPDGGYYGRKSDDPNQEYLIKPEPDLSPLRCWLISRLPRRWKALEDELRGTLWRVAHLNEVVRELRKEGVIGGRHYAGKFTPSTNPELVLLHAPGA